MRIKMLNNLDIPETLSFLSKDYFYNADVITSIESIGFERGKLKAFAILDDFDDVDKKAKMQREHGNKSAHYIALLYVNREEAHIYMPIPTFMQNGLDANEKNSELDEYYNNYNDQIEALDHIVKLITSLNLSSISISEHYEIQLNRYFDSKKIVKQMICAYEIDIDKGFDFDARLRLNRNCQINKNYSVISAKPKADISRKLINLHKSCFDTSAYNAYQHSKLIYKNLIRAYYIEQAGVVVSKGEWIANNPKIGYISGLCTHEMYRKRRLASSLLYKMIRDIISENRVPILRYETPELSEFYTCLGFKLIDVRSILWLKI